MKKLKFSAVAQEIMQTRKLSEKSKITPDSIQVCLYAHLFNFKKGLKFSSFFFPNFFRFKSLIAEPGEPKTKKARQRKPCEHCNKVHNVHKEVKIGCRFSNGNKAPTFKSSSSKKRTMNTPDPSLEPSSDSSESEQGSIHGPEYWENVSKSSSEYLASVGSDNDEPAPPNSPNRQNIINEYLNEIENSEDNLSAENEDNDSYISSDDDCLMPELYDDSDDSEGEGDLDSNSDHHEDDLWTEEDLIGRRAGKFKTEPPAFPKYTPELKPGPIFLHPCTSFPIDFFHLYFDSSLMAIFVENTNISGAEIVASINKTSKGPNKGPWTPTTTGELYRLFGVFLQMGIKRQPSMRSYWSNDPRYSDAFVKKCFSRERFELLKKALHCVNPSAYSNEEIKNKQKEDSFWRVKPFLDHLCDKYQLHFVCGQNLDVDEMCIGFKGRHVARCYNPNKPEKWHLKAFCLNDSKTGYLHRFYMYQGCSFYSFSKIPN